MSAATALWRRLDGPGHDACRLDRLEAVWSPEGAAALRGDGLDAQLSYELRCDGVWHSERGRGRGWIGERRVCLEVVREAGGWSLDGVSQPGLDGCVDLDLGFPPATHLTQLRRLGRAVGQGADVPVAWLDLAQGTLALLPQRCERRTQTRWWYASPTFGYADVLEVGAAGFVRRYRGRGKPRRESVPPGCR